MFDYADDKITINYIANRRNILLLDGFGTRRLLFDPDKTPAEAIYESLKRYSFRLVLRDVIKYRSGIHAEMLTPFIDRDTAQKMLEEIADMSVIRPADNGSFILERNHIESFGDTLEWFIATILKREFGAHAGWSIKLQTPGVGGDYDVLALIENNLVYIETKSSPPAHIEQASMAEFCLRVETVRPAMAAVLVDTHLRMKDKIVPAVEHVFRSRGYNCNMSRLSGEIFHFKHCLYVLNSKSDLISNLKKVIADFLTHKNYFL